MTSGRRRAWAMRRPGSSARSSPPGRRSAETSRCSRASSGSATRSTTRRRSTNCSPSFSSGRRKRGARVPLGGRGGGPPPAHGRGTGGGGRRRNGSQMKGLGSGTPCATPLAQGGGGTGSPRRSNPPQTPHFLRPLFGVEEERTKVVHSVWSGGDDDKAGRHKITSRSKGHKATTEEVPIQNLHGLAEGIGAACSRLMPYMFGGKPHSVATETNP